MKILSYTSVKFAKRALVRKIHSKLTLQEFMKTRRPSNVICVIIQLAYTMTLEDTLNVFMKISNHTNVIFAKRSLDGRLH
jgi:hypothetical protein